MDESQRPGGNDTTTRIDPGTFFTCATDACLTFGKAEEMFHLPLPEGTTTLDALKRYVVCESCAERYAATRFPPSKRKKHKKGSLLGQAYFRLTEALAPFLSRARNEQRTERDHDDYLAWYLGRKGSPEGVSEG